MIEAVQEFFRRLRGDSPELRRVINDHDPDGSLTLGVDFLRLNDVLETAAEEIAESVREKLPESIPIYTGGRR